MNWTAILSKLYCGLANGVIWNMWENQTVKAGSYLLDVRIVYISIIKSSF